MYQNFDISTKTHGLNIAEYFSGSGTEMDEDAMEDLKVRDISKLGFEIDSTQRTRDRSPGFEGVVLLAALLGLCVLVRRRGMGRSP